MAQELTTDVASAQSTSPLPRMTFEEFLEWTDEQNFAEWVDGEVILMSPVSLRHQTLAAFLAASLQFFVEAQELGLVLTAPFLIRLALRPSGREPDVIFVSQERRQNLTSVYLNGPPDLIIEIISPDSRTRDRKDKYSEYQQAGVREYWLLDPVRKTADFYGLNEAGIYETMPCDAEGIFHSEVLAGLWMKVEWFWQEPLPPLMSILKEWGLIKA